MCVFIFAKGVAPPSPEPGYLLVRVDCRVDQSILLYIRRF